MYLPRSSINNKDNIMSYIKHMGKLEHGGSIGVPDYTKRESRTKGTNYTASKDGWVYIYTRGGDTTGGLTATVTINRTTFKQAYRIGDYGASAASILLPVKAGDTYLLSGAIDSMEMWFIPPVGGGNLLLDERRAA